MGSTSDQEVQLETVLQKFGEYDKAILVGDLNVNGDFPILQKALQDELATDAHAGLSLSQAEAAKKIDWILVRGLSVLDAGIANSPASDHPFYWAKIALD